MTFAMGFLLSPEISEDTSSRDGATFHMGYIQFEEDVGLSDVINFVGIKFMHFLIANDMYYYISEFEKFCLDDSFIYYLTGIPTEPMEVQSDNTYIITDGMSVNQRRSTTLDGVVPPEQNDKEEFSEAEERSETMNHSYASSSMSSMTAGNQGSNRFKSEPAVPIVVDDVDVVDLTKDSFEDNVVQSSAVNSIDDQSTELTFQDETETLDRNVGELKSRRGVQCHVYKFYTISVLFIQKFPFSETNRDGVFHEKFEVTRDLLDKNCRKVEECPFCKKKPKRKVIAHPCSCKDCRAWNVFHWVCFQANFAVQLNTGGDTPVMERYLVKCYLCARPLFQNHKYLSIC